MSITVRLAKGLVVDGEPQREAVLKPLSARDIIEAGQAAERLVYGEDGPVLLVSPSRMGAELLARQIERIGSVPGPISLGMFDKLSSEDLALLQAAAGDLDQAVASEVAARGRDRPAGAGAD
ncbi:MAG: hypothetical protein D6717_00350 [Gammaproteobacteria bacterium]|nr:MAG: hypothetical protein D6717_00350 [Gammaproteobacteria bacterium]